MNFARGSGLSANTTDQQVDERVRAPAQSMIARDPLPTGIAYRRCVPKRFSLNHEQRVCEGGETNRVLLWTIFLFLSAHPRCFRAACVTRFQRLSRELFLRKFEQTRWDWDLIEKCRSKFLQVILRWRRKSWSNIMISCRIESWFTF